MIEIFISIIVLLNILVSFHIFKRDDLNSFQKKAQIIIIWIIPFIASIGIYIFHKNNESEKKYTENSNDSDTKNYENSSSHGDF